MSKSKICFVSPHLYPIISSSTEIPFAGGAEVQQSMIAEGLLGLGYQVSAVTLDYGQEDGCNINGVRVFKAYRPHAGIRGIRFFYPRLTGIWRALHNADADIYYQRTAGMLTGVVAKYCSIHGRKFIYAGAHDQDFITGSHGIRFRRDKLLYEWGLRHAHRVVVQNETQKKSLKKNYGVDGTLLHNIGAGSNNRARWEERKVGWVGMMRRWKKPSRFIELAKKCPEFEFLMVGGPGENKDEHDLYSNVRNEAADLDNLVLTGHILYREISDTLNTLSILINTSDCEGFPNTFLEAWARGIPTVSYISVDLGTERATPGIVVKDSRELIDTVYKLMSDKVTWEKESSRSLELFNQYFRFSGVAEEYRNLFDSLIKNNQ